MIFPNMVKKTTFFDSYDWNKSEPHIRSAKKKNNSKDDFELIPPRLLNGNIYTKCRQTPMVNKLKIVNNIGGY
jgi:hypothetical protein